MYMSVSVIESFWSKMVKNRTVAPFAIALKSLGVMSRMANHKRGYKAVLQISREDMQEYGALFKSLRESIGLNLAQMAKEIGVFRTTISLWEKGKTIPQQDIYLIETKYKEVVAKYKNLPLD